MLHGVGSEGVAAILEAISALISGFLFGFYFSWPVACVGLAVTPFIVFGSFF